MVTVPFATLWIGTYRSVQDPMACNSARPGCCRVFKKLKLLLVNDQPLVCMFMSSRLIELERARVAILPST